EDLNNLGWQDLLTPESLEKAFLFMDDKLIESWFTEEETKEPHFIEMEFNKKDGTAVSVEVNLSALSDDNNQLIGILGVARDITNRKRLDEALREREEKYRLLFDNSNEGIIVTQKGLLKFFNPKAVEFTKYSQKELSAKSFYDLIHPDDRDFVEKLHKKNLKDCNEPEMYSVRLIDKYKNIKWVEINEVQINWEDSLATLNFLTDITYRHTAEEALINSEERYRTISELISDFVYSIRVEQDGTNVPEWSTDTLQRVLGISYSEMLKKGGWINYIHPDDLSILKKRQEALAKGKSDVSEYRVITKTGDVLWIRDYGHPVWDGSQGRVVRIYGAAQDITEHKVADEKLKHSEERFRQFFENEPEYCYMISPDGWILDVNKAALKALGYKKSELVGKPMNVIYAPESIEKAKKVFTKWKKTKKIKDEELVIVAKSGSRRTVLLNASVVKDKDGKILHSISVHKDITEHKEAEEAIRESEEKFRTLAENSPNMIFINQFGKIVYVNKKCEEIMGYKRKEFYSKNFDFMKLIAPESKEVIMKAFKFHKEGKEVPTFEYAILTRKGEKLDAFYNSRIIKFRGAPAILGTILDITERKKAEKALRDSEKKYRTLINNVTDIIIEVDVEGNFSYLSPNIQSIAGFKPEELVGESAFQYVHPDDLEKVLDVMEGVFNTNEQYEITFRTKHKKGHYIWVEGRGNFIKKDNDVKLVGSLRDVTEHKQSEDALRQSEERFRNLADLLPEGVF
ncbi:MAG: PAS domain S-box protein, partial [Candidatus Thorarchaeota archaeon]